MHELSQYITPSSASCLILLCFCFVLCLVGLRDVQPQVADLLFSSGIPILTVLNTVFMKRLVFKPMQMGSYACFAATGACHNSRWHRNDVWLGTGSWNLVSSPTRCFRHHLLGLHCHQQRPLFHRLDLLCLHHQWLSFLRSLFLLPLPWLLLFSTLPLLALPWSCQTWSPPHPGYWRCHWWRLSRLVGRFQCYLAWPSFQAWSDLAALSQHAVLAIQCEAATSKWLDHLEAEPGREEAGSISESHRCEESSDHSFSCQPAWPRYLSFLEWGGSSPVWHRDQLRETSPLSWPEPCLWVRQTWPGLFVQKETGLHCQLLAPAIISLLTPVPSILDNSTHIGELYDGPSHVTLMQVWGGVMHHTIMWVWWRVTPSCLCGGASHITQVWCSVMLLVSF